ncbi:MAG: transcription termination/antitermination factor NusG [Spirochaetes bacterium GWF1_31_7]|nr:MAG: transcription termination/antitermination factor NusG [Spirochaetes bacterium GWE1_32_154]OHD47331.1 MAG: transcription termination/antitermination factor NusG [Spirochaetes bacterium GWE2_31_10]OHD53190.1 MAG: transcription termination/antitermination factor NusG [Spirochaetes bacterium GWF1_31_7]OHD78373.1 MAG: transcription termination/antitermination factor NusG [Spirochaetes bacterium RIFOXYB1_FULL_32_8]HBD95001.1 transcription termination/antitermination protein NusG [Spirochaetia
MAKNWYILHIYSGYEKKVEDSLKVLIKDSIEDNSVVSKILFQVKVPVKEVFEMKNGKKKVSEKKIFPGYVLLEMDLDKNNWQDVYPIIKNIHGVTGFVGANKNKKPQPLNHDEVRSILLSSNDSKNDVFMKQKYDFNRGETVKIIDGPFNSFSGTIEEVNLEKSKIKVMVGIFGRSTPVELDFTQVEKI